MVDRIADVYGLATADERSEGAAWYDDAAAIAAIVGDGNVSRGAGILAALSPQCLWDDNVDRALRHGAGESVVGAFNDALRKADAIAAGADPLDVLGGRKVRSFYRNIVGHTGHVTVDRHAMAIVAGRPLTVREVKVLERIGPYTYVASAYRAAARRLGVAPTELQAVTWLVWRRLKGDAELGAF
jgi:hypothetical protein